MEGGVFCIHTAAYTGMKSSFKLTVNPLKVVKQKDVSINIYLVSRDRGSLHHGFHKKMGKVFKK